MAMKRGAVQRRQRLCDGLWPDAREFTYNYKDEPGFCTIPRTLPMIAALAKYLTPNLDPSGVYLELWARDMSPPPPYGFVEIDDEDECAAAAGFRNRVRSWRERVDALEALGFIRTAPKGSRERGYVLLLHPHRVVQDLKDAGRVPSWWWSTFTHRLAAVGARLPKPVMVPTADDDPFADFRSRPLADEEDLPF